MNALHVLLAAGRAIALTKAPYLGARIRGFDLREAPGLGTTAATADGSFLYDAAEIAKWLPEKLAFSFAHEALHMTFAHHKRGVGLEAKRANLAMDLAINDSVVAIGLAADPHDALPAKFGFPSGLTFEAYYALLEAKGQAGEGSPTPDCGNGFCGSCAGRPVPGEPEPGKAGRSSAENARINAEVAKATREHKASKDAGTVPAGLARWAERDLEPPKVAWEAQLARAVKAGVSWKAGAVEHRYDGPSRRQAGIGYGAGRPVMPRLRAPLPRIAIAVDTSGSMSKGDLDRAMSETSAILRAIGAPVTFLACDAAVHGVAKIAHLAQAQLKGGGGTSFIPIFEALSAERPRCDVVVVMTDGYGPAPKEEPAGLRTIWLLIGGNENAPAAWGTTICVDRA